MQTESLIRQSLYNIRVDHLSLIQEIEENGGELTPELEQALTLNNEQFEDKALSYGYIVKTFDDNLSIIDREFERLDAIRERIVKQKEAFKERLSEAMQQYGVEKITTPLLKLSFRKSESVEIMDTQKIPVDYCEEKTVTTINKTMIKQAIKTGLTVPGAELVTKQNLQIK